MLRFDLATGERPRIPKSSMLPRDFEPSAEIGPIVGECKRRPNPRQQRKQRERVCRFRQAVAFAYALDLPLTVGLTVSWGALMHGGERHEGHCLWRSAWEREAYLRRELSRLCRTLGYPFAALWGRDVGKHMGSHVHIAAMFLPTRYLRQLVELLERVSGSPAAYVFKPYDADTVARSTCGGWQVEMNRSNDHKASALRWAEYIAEQEAKHPETVAMEGKPFGISEALGRAAQRRAEPALAARRTQMGGLGK